MYYIPWKTSRMSIPRVPSCNKTTMVTYKVSNSGNNAITITTITTITTTTIIIIITITTTTSPRTFVSRPTSTEKLERAKSEIFEARLDLSPDTNSISASMISMKLNYDGYSNNKIHHDYYSCINDFLANHNNTTTMTLKIPMINKNDHANANDHANSNKNTMILPNDNIEEVVRVLDQYFDTTDGISYECK